MYTRVESRFWQDEAMRSVSCDAKYLMLYLLTSPHRNILGLYFLPAPYASFDLGWDEGRFTKALKELSQTGSVKYDPGTHMVLVYNFLKHYPLENPNQVKSAVQKLDTLPQTPLFKDFYDILQQLDKPFIEPLTKQLIKQLPQQDQDQEEEPKEEELKTQLCVNPGGAAENNSQEYTSDFEQFWSAYPKHREKKKALKCWNTRLKEKEDPGKMIAAAKHYALECGARKIDERYIKYAATFLGPNKPYEDYLMPPAICILKGGENDARHNGLDQQKNSENTLSDDCLFPRRYDIPLN